MLSRMIEQKDHDGEWEPHLRAWLPGVFDICNAMNGYKNGVEKETLYTSGSKILGSEPVHSFDMEEETAPETANGFHASTESSP